MTTVADLITATQRHLRGMTRSAVNVLNGALDASATTFMLTYDPAADIGVGSQVVIDDEIMYVFDVDATSKVLTVRREHLGTTAATHADGALIECNPRFPRPFIRQALQDEINSWPTNVYATASLTVSVANGLRAVDLTSATAMLSVLEVLRKPTSLDTFTDVWRPVGFRPERTLPTTTFPSGFALFMDDPGPYDARVTYAKPFVTTTFTDATDVVTTVGLEASMTDIPPYGAVWRLLSGQEVLRTALEAQGQSRNPQEVPVGQTVRAAASFQGFRDLRLQAEAARLLDRYGWRMT